jgi:hypothetical protein
VGEGLPVGGRDVDLAIGGARIHREGARYGGFEGDPAGQQVEDDHAEPRIRPRLRRDRGQAGPNERDPAADGRPLCGDGAAELTGGRIGGEDREGRVAVLEGVSTGPGQRRACGARPERLA